MIKTYRQVLSLRTFEEIFEYLKLEGVVSQDTFGFDRYLNQDFYRSREWKKTRNDIIVRDDGCDLGIPNREIYGRITIHHLNPITVDNIERGDDCVFDPENLICTSHITHNAIHYGDASLLTKLPKKRTKGDTSLWTAYSLL